MSTTSKRPGVATLLARSSHALIIAGTLAAVAPWAAAPAFAASGSDYGTWSPLIRAQTMDIPVNGFPAAAVHTNSTTAPVLSGKSAFLNASTPVGARYGSSQNKPYVNLRTALLGAPSTTTLTFDRPTPAGTWAFTLGDVDADRVVVAAHGADGKPLTTAELGWQGSFNYCQGTPKPLSCLGSGPFTDQPVWNPATSTLVGTGTDTSGASGWFQPLVPVTSITLTFSVQTGIPIYQLWTSSLAADISGEVAATCGTPTGTRLTLRHEDGTAVTGVDGAPLTTVVAADGSYRFADVAPGPYRVTLDALDGYTPATAAAEADTTGAKNATNVDFRLSCQVIRAPATPPVDAPWDGPITIVTPPGPGPSGNSHPAVEDPPAHGTVVVGPHNTLIYTPRPGFIGTDHFSYRSLNVRGQTVVHTVTVRVRRALAPTGANPALPGLALTAVTLLAVGTTLRVSIRGRARRADGKAPR